MSTLKKLWPVAGLAACLLVSTVAGQYAGPKSNANAKQVSEILKNPVDDEDVVIGGQRLREGEPDLAATDDDDAHGLPAILAELAIAVPTPQTVRLLGSGMAHRRMCEFSVGAPVEFTLLSAIQRTLMFAVN